VVEVCGLIDGARVGGFEFGIVSNRGDGRHWTSLGAEGQSC
jgi:predicted nucleotidyltransferase component of viral defense system